MLDDMISQAIFNILGPTPSRPVDIPGSSLRMNSATCDEWYFEERIRWYFIVDVID